LLRRGVQFGPGQAGEDLAPGAKLTASIIREMKRRGSRYGMVTMCVGTGMGAAGIIERM